MPYPVWKCLYWQYSRSVLTSQMLESEQFHLNYLPYLHKNWEKIKIKQILKKPKSWITFLHRLSLSTWKSCCHIKVTPIQYFKKVRFWPHPIPKLMVLKDFNDMEDVDMGHRLNWDKNKTSTQPICNVCQLFYSINANCQNKAIYYNMGRNWIDNSCVNMKHKKVVPLYLYVTNYICCLRGTAPLTKY